MTRLPRPLSLVASLLLALTVSPPGLFQLTTLSLYAQQLDPPKPARVVTGQVLSARDKKPLKDVPVSLGTLRTQTDERGVYRFSNPPAGNQLVIVEPQWLLAKRQKLADATLTGAWHADPAMVEIADSGFTEVPAPIFVIEPTKKSHRLTPGKGMTIQPAEVPEMIVTIPEDTTILGPDGTPQTEMTVTPLSPDRVPPLPPDAAPRTVYLFSFDNPGGGTPSKPVPVIYPNDLGAPPGERIDLWYYDKTDRPDSHSHQWKKYGQGTVSSDGKTIVPDPGVGQPKFCVSYPTWPNFTYPNLGFMTAGDPVDPSSGVLSIEKTDLVLSGVLPIAIVRAYRTQAQGVGAFGMGGEFNYNLYISGIGTAALSLLMPNGNRYTFSQEVDGYFRNQNYPFLKGARAQVFPDSHVEIRWKDGMVYVFSQASAGAAWLMQQKDRYNNSITITRSPLNQRVDSIADQYGRTLKFGYTTTANQAGSALITSITDPMGRTVGYQYDALHRLSTITAPDGGVTIYTYDVNNRLTTITDPRGITYLTTLYYPSGLVAKQILADGGTYRFEYTLAGSTITQAKVTDPRGNPTTYTFNNYQFVSQIDAPGQTTQFQLQSSTNYLTQVTDALGRTTAYTYDSNGNVASITDPENNTTAFEYDATYSRLTKITDAMTPANITTFSYPSLAQTTITDPLGKVTTIAYNSQGQPTSITDPLAHATTFEYDAFGNLKTTVDALNNRTERTYDAISRLVGIKDPRGFVTAFRYDTANRVRLITDAKNGTTQFSYDLNGNLLTVTDAKSQMTTYTYDSMDRLATRKDALNRQESYQYDLAGNLTQFTDRKSQVTTFGYDALNRRTGATYVGSSTTFGYDAISRLTSVNDSVGGTITWVYDVVGKHPRVAETTNTGTVTVEYDEIGRRAKLSATGLTDTTYAYDKNSRLTGVTRGSQTVTLAYDDAGRRTSLTYPNGVVTSYGYDNANRLLTINHVKTSTTIEALTYQYDTASNRVSLNRANAAASLIPTAVSSNSYDAANQQTQFSGVTQTFDANGNLTNDGTNTYTWDSRNRLTGISGVVTASYIYDGLGRRKSKTIGGTTTGFWYDGNDILADLSGGTPSATYVRGLNIDEPYIRKGTSDEFYEADALGSSVALTNGAGASQTTYTYEAFGNTTQGGTASANTFQFTGRENDGANAYYYRARYYHPKVQRFISEDPLDFTGRGTNLYSFVDNDPVNFTDPLGLQAIPAPIPGPPVPFPIPPIAIPGSPQNQQAVKATAEAFRQFQDAISQSLRKCGTEEECDKQYEKDLKECRSLPSPAARSRCYASANNRYGACRAGKPLPPLIKW
ncbi:MAG: RHS repeat-associated core domain-containing protein [Nitrospiraceae bacterium]